MPSTPPYILEDRTGINSASDFDDLYDRIFYRVARPPQQTTTMFYSMNRRGSRHRDSLPFTQQPIAKLVFASDESLGNVSFVQQRNQVSTIPMNRYLRKVSIFGGYVTSLLTPILSNLELAKVPAEKIYGF